MVHLKSNKEQIGDQPRAPLRILLLVDDPISFKRGYFGLSNLLENFLDPQEWWVDLHLILASRGPMEKKQARQMERLKSLMGNKAKKETRIHGFSDEFLQTVVNSCRPEAVKSQIRKKGTKAGSTSPNPAATVGARISRWNGKPPRLGCLSF